MLPRQVFCLYDLSHCSILPEANYTTCCEFIQVWCEICGWACVCYNTIWLYIACWTDNLNKVYTLLTNWNGVDSLIHNVNVCVKWRRWPLPTHRYDKFSHYISLVCVVLHFTASYLLQKQRWRPCVHKNDRPPFQVSAAAGIRSTCNARPWSLDFKSRPHAYWELSNSVLSKLNKPTVR